jgi:hypothetical protein
MIYPCPETLAYKGREYMESLGMDTVVNNFGETSSVFPNGYRPSIVFLPNGSDPMKRVSIAVCNENGHFYWNVLPGSGEDGCVTVRTLQEVKSTIDKIYNLKRGELR